MRASCFFSFYYSSSMLRKALLLVQLILFVPLIGINTDFCFADTVGTYLRSNQLDDLARMILLKKRIPEAGELLLLSAAAGWPGMTTSVQLVPSFISVEQVLESVSRADTVVYGTCSDIKGNTILVTADKHTCIPFLDSYFIREDRAVSFIIYGIEEIQDAEVLVLTPQMEVFELFPDSSGNLSIENIRRGIYWVEVISNKNSNPHVEILFPLIAGYSLMDVLTGCIRFYSSGSVSLDDIFAEINLIRKVKGLEEVERNEELDSLARIRSCSLVLTNDLDHQLSDFKSLGDLLAEKPEYFAENLSRARSFAEAASMIFISPSHLYTVLDERYSQVGISASVQVDESGWQIVLVEIFTSIR